MKTPTNTKELIDLLLDNGIIDSEEVVNVYDDHIEVYGVSKEFTFMPWFEDNFFKLFVPIDGELVVTYVDYGEEVDIKERKAVKRFVKDNISPLIPHKSLNEMTM